MAKKKTQDFQNMTAQELKVLLKNDRLARGLKWKDYAKFLDVKMSTLMKIMRDVTKQPQELTVNQILQRIALPQTRAKTGRATDQPEPAAEPEPADEPVGVQGAERTGQVPNNIIE